MAESSAPDIKPPTPGESTGAQAGGGGAAAGPGLPGAKAPMGSDYDVYRRIRGNPTVSMARLAATLPIKTAELSFVGPQASPEMIELAQAATDRLWGRFIRDTLVGIEYGWAPMELIWGVRDGRLVPERAKPLSVDMTEVLLDAGGNVIGLEQDKLQLVGPKAFVWSHDAEAGAPYGRSRYEGIRKTWAAWEHLLEQLGKYATKAAGVIPLIEYPEGQSRDAGGRTVDNFDIAKQILAALGRGHGVAMPNTLAKFADDLARSGVDITKLKAWTIDFLEAGHAHGYEMTQMMAHLEKQLARGMWVTERSIFEAASGTRADADAHGDVTTAAAYDTLLDILDAYRQQVIRPLLTFNFGPDAADLVRIEPARPNRDAAALMREVVKGVLTNPANVDLLLTLVDVDAVLDQAGVPKLDATADPDSIRRRRDEDAGDPDPADPEDDPAPEPAARPMSRLARRLLAALQPKAA